MVIKLMDEVRYKIGVHTTCGIGTNLYLAKIALDITAKHSPDFIGYLDEITLPQNTVAAQASYRLLAHWARYGAKACHTVSIQWSRSPAPMKICFIKLSASTPSF